MIVDHEGPCYEIWTLPLFIFTGLTAILTPFEITYVVKKDTFRTLNGFLNIFFWLDLLLNFRLTREYVDKKKGGERRGFERRGNSKAV